MGWTRRCQRRPRKPRSTMTRTSPPAIQRTSAERSTSAVAWRSTPWSTNHSATIETAKPPTTRTVERFGIIGPPPVERSDDRPRRLRRPCRELRGAADAHPVEQVPGDDPQRRQPVHDAPPEADRARLLEVARRDRDIADPPAEPRRDDLGDQLLVEDEVVAVELVRDRLQEAPAVRPQAGVVLGQAQPERQIL